MDVSAKKEHQLPLALRLSVIWLMTNFSSLFVEISYGAKNAMGEVGETEMRN
jgi:hypothetical protein